MSYTVNDVSKKRGYLLIRCASTKNRVYCLMQNEMIMGFGCMMSPVLNGLKRSYRCVPLECLWLN